MAETTTRKVIARLKREGWQRVGGTKHDKYEHPDRPEMTIVVPRHRQLSIGVARDAGW